MKARFAVLFLSAVLSMVMPLVVTAEAVPTAFVREPRLVVYQYDGNLTYSVIAAPGMLTDIAIGRDEKLLAFALGDTVQWVTAKADGHIFVKPTVEGLATTATLITDKRTYQLSLRSVDSSNNNWHQRISWNYPEIILFERQKTAAAKEALNADQQVIDRVVADREVAVESLNFDYTVSGDAEFKPVTVFDDGKFTWIRMRDVQEMPAVFLLNDGKTGDLVNYQINQSYIVVNRLIHGILLKLGTDEIKIVNNKSKARKTSPGFTWAWE